MARKIFSYSNEGSTEGFLFPGSTLPGPEPDRLDADMHINGETLLAGSIDPNWVAPEINVIPLGAYNNREWFSLRDDISCEHDTLGEFDPRLDPTEHISIDADLNAALIENLVETKAIKAKYDQRFINEYPTPESIVVAMRDDLDGYNAFVASEQTAMNEEISNLGLTGE